MPGGPKLHLAEHGPVTSPHSAPPSRRNRNDQELSNRVVQYRRADTRIRPGRMTWMTSSAPTGRRCRARCTGPTPPMRPRPCKPPETATIEVSARVGHPADRAGWRPPDVDMPQLRIAPRYASVFDGTSPTVTCRAASDPVHSRVSRSVSVAVSWCCHRANPRL
jgi:hypothetical protein